MQDYRVRIFDRPNQVGAELDLYCYDDAEAVGRAKARLAGGAGELWQRDRFVQRFEPRERPPAAHR